MDPSVQRLLTDKLYDKRKQGALELEKLVRDSCAAKDYEKIRKIVEQLCHDYAYAVHQPHARNGGLIGLAAASIALGSDEVARYLQQIVPPVLACFTDQDARVRYYACESMYNIAKVAKGEILLFFNDIFDSLCKLAADSELSVKNGAELLDRLVKDIVAESAATYVSILNFNEKYNEESKSIRSDHSEFDFPTAFSLERFIPLLEERIHVINPFTRTFLVSWLTLLDTIPDLELVHYLPAFLGGLFKFLGDPNRDVYVATQNLLDRFLNEITKIAKIKKGIAESRKSRASARRRPSYNSRPDSAGDDSTVQDNAIDDSEAESEHATEEDDDGDWIPGQDVEIDYTKILDILLKFVDVSSNKDTAPTLRIEGLSKQKEEEIGIVALKWIGTFFEVSPEDILPFVPRLLSQVLPALSAQSEQVRTTASGVNRSLMDYIVKYHEDMVSEDRAIMPPPAPKAPEPTATRASVSQPSIQQETSTEQRETPEVATPRSSAAPSPEPYSGLDYAAAVNALTLQFLNVHEETRIAALTWLIMLHRKAPKKVLAFNDGTFPALLKTLSDPAETVVTRDLQLLSQISKNSDDSYFSSFMVALLQLFSTDRKLLEIRGNLIIRQLCINLMPERIYRTLADIIEKEEDIEFASIMVQNLNNNLITAPELSELRKRLRNLDNKDGQAFFIALFKAWCHNAVATFSLCLLTQAYEQAYNLLQVFADMEMTVNTLIQIDKLVQLLESPVFTYLRLQLLEPDRYPYLYKCLYGLLMLLPQSSAFAALKNRLNSVSSIGLLHTPAAMPTSARPSYVALRSPGPNPGSLQNHHTDPYQSGISTGVSSTTMPNTTTSSAVRRARDIGSTGDVKWTELLDKFRQTQDKAHRRNLRIMRGDDSEIYGNGSDPDGNAGTAIVRGSHGDNDGRASRASARDALEAVRPGSGLSGGPSGLKRPTASFGYAPANRSAAQGTGVGGSGVSSGIGERPGHKSKHSLTGGFGKFASNIARGAGGRKDDKNVKK